MAIVEACNKRRQAREAFEWKLSIAFWTLIALATEFLSRTDTADVSPCIRVCAAVIAFFIYLVFAVGLAGGHKGDDDRSQFYHRQATALLSASSSMFVIARLKRDRDTDEREANETGKKSCLAKIGLCLVTVWRSWCDRLKALPTAYGQIFQLFTTAFLLGAFCVLAHPHSACGDLSFF